MALPNSARAIPYHFDSDRFRNAIRFVFEMGSSTQAPPTFHFADTITVSGSSDSEVVPFDPAVPVTRTQAAAVTIPCDVAFEKAADEPTPFGVVVPAKVTITMLDEDYQVVKDAIYVVVDGDRYNRNYEIPDFALFDVGVHQMVFIAENER